jgi:hypothetical protein
MASTSLELLNTTQVAAAETVGAAPIAPCIFAAEQTIAATGIKVIVCKAPGMNCAQPDYCRQIEACYYEKQSQ